MPDGADLEHDHADRMRDDVVQLARDPRPLLRDRDARRRLALPLRLARAGLGRLGLLGRSRRAKPASQATANRSGDEDELAESAVQDDHDTARER